MTVPTVRRLSSFSLVGAAYKSWGRSPGFTHVFIECESQPRYYGEGTSLRQIQAQLEAEGIDCSRIDQWVKTGEGTSFRLV